MNRRRLLGSLFVLAAISATVAVIVATLPDREILPEQEINSSEASLPGQTSPAVTTPSPSLSREKEAYRGMALRVVRSESNEWYPQWARTKSPELDALYALAERDLRAALAEAERQYANARYDELQTVLAAHALEKDFANAKALCGALKGTMLQTAIRRAVPAAYRRDRAGTTSIIFDQLSNKAQELATRSIVETQLKDGDLHAAIQMQLRLPEGYTRTESANLIAAKISSADLGAGLRWFEQLTSDRERKNAHSAIAANLFRARDADGLTQLLALTPPEETLRSGGTQPWWRDMIIRQIAQLRRQSGDSSGLDALRAMLPVEEKEHVDVQILSEDRAQPLQDRFARAAALTYQKPRAAAIRTVIEFAAKQNPQRTADFVLRLENETFKTALWSLANQWKPTDGAGLANWVRGLPPGPRREDAITAFVQIHGNGSQADRELALEFADLAASQESRERLKREVGPLSIVSESERAAGKQ